MKYPEFSLYVYRMLAGFGCGGAAIYVGLPYLNPKIKILMNEDTTDGTVQHYKLLDEVRSDMKSDEKNVTTLCYNNNSLFKADHGGGFIGKMDCLIVLPRSLLLQSRDDWLYYINSSAEQYIDKDSGSAIGFEETIALMNNRRVAKFVIARELTKAVEVVNTITFSHTFFSFFLTYIPLQSVTRRVQSVLLVKVGQSLVLCAALMLALWSRKKLYHWTEFEVDKITSKLGEEYRDGGIQLYNSMIQVEKMTLKDSKEDENWVNERLNEIFNLVPAPRDMLQNIEAVT